MITFPAHGSIIALALLLPVAHVHAADVPAASITPDPVAISLRAGEVGGTPVKLTNPTGSLISYRLLGLDANSRPATLEGQLDAIVSSGDTLNGPLPLRYDFTGGDAGATSLNGALPNTLNLLNNGNRLLTNLGGPLAYTDTGVASSAVLGTGGRYFTRKMPGLFVFGAETNGITWFEVAGALSYGTAKQSSTFELSHSGNRWSAFVVNHVDVFRTINHLVLVDQGGLQQTVGDNSSQQHRITGLSGKRRIYHFLYVTSTTAVQPKAVFENLAVHFLDLLPWIGSRLSFDPALGTIPSQGQSDSLVKFDAISMPPGSYEGKVQLATAGGGPLATVPVSIQVTEPRLEVPGSFSKVMLPGMVAETVRVPLTSNLTAAQAWTASLEAPVSWLSVASPQGTTPADLQLRFDPTGLAFGSYLAAVRIVSGTSSFSLPVSLRVVPLSIRKFLADPNRSRVYAVNQDAKLTGQLIEIDVASRRILRACDVGQEPSGLDLTENGRQIMVMNTTSASLSRVSLEDFSVVETIPLADFSNRNEDVGGHVKCGKGDIVYYVDEQWGPRLRVFNAATRTVLQTLSAESGNSPDVSNNDGYGDISLSPDRSRLFGWSQYGDGAGSSGIHIVRFSVNPDGTLGGFAQSASYYLTNFARQPFDTPVMFSLDGSRLIIKDREIDQVNLDFHRVIYPDGIFTITPNADIVIGRSAIYSARGDETLLTLPVASSIHAVSADYSSLVYFNTTAKSIGWVDLRTSPGYARMGLAVTPADGTNVVEPESLRWLPQAGVTRYQVYLGSDRAKVGGATASDAEFLGETSDIRFTLGGGLTAGMTYYWRVVPLDAAGNATGPGVVSSFHIGGLLLSRQKVESTAVRGLVSQPESIALNGAAPIAWTASESTPWISGITASGTTPSTLNFTIDTTGLAVGYHQGSVTITSADGPITVPVELRVTEPNLVKLLRHPQRAVVYALHQAATGEGFSQVLEIDAVSARTLRSSPLGITAPTDSALDAETGRLFVANAGSAPTLVVDVDAWQPLAPLDLGDVYRIQVASGARLVTLGSTTGSNVMLWNATTGEKLATILASNNGDIKTDQSGEILYLAGNGSSGSNLKKYNIKANAFELLINGPQISYGSRNLVLSPDGFRVFWLARVMDPGLNILAQIPSSAEIHATNQSGDLAVTDSKVFWSDGAAEVATLPFTSTIAAISANDSYLVRYNATTRTLHSTPLATIADLPGPKPRPGQLLDASPAQFSWTPVKGAVSYRFYLAESSSALSAMTGPTAIVNSPLFTPATPLDFGRIHFWRADAVTANGTVIPGKVQSFGIHFPAGPAFANNGLSETGLSTSISDRHLFVGVYGAARLCAFDPDTGIATDIQRFTPPVSNSSFGAVVAVDAGKAVVGAATYANPASNGGAASVYRPSEFGYWESRELLAPPSPVANEQFGYGLAAAGNLMLVGTGNNTSGIGRVCAYITEPQATQTQTFSANDGVSKDGFGRAIAMDGNLAVISAPGNGVSFNRVPCLYAFSRSTSTGMWTQTQKVSIPGATSSDSSGRALALSGGTLATTIGNSAVILYTLNPSGQWVQSATINRSASSNSSSSFGSGLALVGDQLFIGDPGATDNGTGGGVVFSFRRFGTSWIPGPVILSPGTRSNFGAALAVRDRWLLAAGSNTQPAWLFKVGAGENRTPRFIPGIPTQVVAGRAFSIPVKAEDADGNGGLIIDKLQGPAWLTVTDNGNGQAILSGTPAGASGTSHTVQIRVRDAAGSQAYHTFILTLLAPTDLPVLVSSPLAADLGIGQELTLRATASGTGPFQWQWFKDGKAIHGATGSIYLISEAGPENAGRYHVSVSNAVGTVESATFEVTVRPANRNAGDWLTFGGSPTHTGRHPAALAGCHFIPAWNAEVQKGYILNRAAISNGRAVVVPQSRFATGISVAGLDLETGTALWSFPVPSSNSTNPPSIYQDKVYFQRGKGTASGDNPQLFSLDAVTGQQLWASTFGAQFEAYEAPAVGDSGIFINGGTYGGMYGFLFNGSQRFYQALPQFDRWTPTLANGRLFSWVGSGTGAAFTEHNPSDGTKLWSIQPGSGQSPYSMYTVPAVAGNSAVIISTTELICVDLPTRSIRWRVSATHRGSPGIADGRVFAIQGNTVRSYSLADGSAGPVYQTYSGTGSGDSLVDQPVLFNDRLAISSEARTWIFNLADASLLQTLNVGGRLSYSNGHLLAAGNDGVMRAFAALNYNPKLASLELGSGGYLPDFNSQTTRYIATVPFDTETVTITPTTQYPDATVRINGVPESNGSASRQLPVNVGGNELRTLVTAEDGITTMTYSIVVTRLPREFVFNSAADLPLNANGFNAGDFPVNIILNYPPVPGTTLTMVNNIGLDFIHGRFSNLAQGQRVWLSHDGKMYPFVVNYHGGTGNDLVLQWAGTRVSSWGLNNYGQLGDGGSTQRLKPVAVNHSGVLADKTILAVSTGYLHSVALSSDGTLASWGYNVQGQLGDNGTANKNVPVTVDATGVLSGKTVVAISSGLYHNLALCSDGTVATWGYNNHGQLGDGSTTTARVPVLVVTDGILSGKQVVAVAAGAYQSYALCSDGTLAAWGYNDEGELGNGTTTGSTVPVAVDAGGVLLGREISKIAAGQYHTLALCTDGTLVSWGYNQRGQLGNSSTTDSKSPVAISPGGAFTGRTVKAIGAGASHSVALCTDGTFAAWGYNTQGQLGVAGITQSTAPVALAPMANAAGRTIQSLTTGANHNLLRFTDGGMTAWGGNTNGQLGAGNTVASATSVKVNTGALEQGGFIMFAASGRASSHNLAVFAVTMDPPVGLEAWRYENFSSVGVASAVAGDCADCDHDGIPNLVEYAFGLDPHQDSSGQVPRPVMVGDHLEIRFSGSQLAADIGFGAEWSPDLSPGSWRDVPDSGTGGEHVFSLPVDSSPHLFMRLRVRSGDVLPK